MIKKVSLRPYHGNLFVTFSRKEYEKACKKYLRTKDILTCAQAGRFNGGEGKDGMWTYVVFASDTPTLAHEMAHVVLHVFERCGIDPIEGNGEPFCYLLSQLIMDSQK